MNNVASDVIDLQDTKLKSFLACDIHLNVVYTVCVVQTIS